MAAPIAATFPSTPQPRQGSGAGVQFGDIDTDGHQWRVEFQAGDRSYCYHAGPGLAAHLLQAGNQGKWETISAGPLTPLAVESVIQNMGGLEWPFAMFRAMYEQRYIGRIEVLCEYAEQERDAIGF